MAVDNPIDQNLTALIVLPLKSVSPLNDAEFGVGIMPLVHFMVFLRMSL